MKKEKKSLERQNKKKRKMGSNNTKPFEGVWFLLKVAWKYDKRYIFLLLCTEIINFATAIISLEVPPRIIDSIFSVNPPQWILASQYLLLLLIIALVAGLLQTFISNRRLVIKTIIYKKFTLELAQRIMSVRYERTETADFLNLKSQAEQFISTGGAGFGVLLEQSFSIIGSIVTLAYYAKAISELQPLLILIVTVLTGATIVLNYKLSKKNIEINLEKAVQERRAGYFSLLTQHFKFGKEIRGNGCDDWVSNRYEKQMNVLQRFYEKKARYGIKYGWLMLFVSLMQQAATYLYLIQITWKRYTLYIQSGVGLPISAGLFTKYLNATGAYSNGLKSIVGGVASINQYNKYYESFKAYYALSDQDNTALVDAVKMPEIDHQMVIRFNDVTFKYPGMDYEALSHVSCEIDKGDIVSIVGSNGAGKSTLIKLLLRLYEPTSGSITINDVDIAKIDRREYAKCFACMFQDFQLLSFSIKDNISLGLDETDPNAESKIDAAIEFAGLTDKVESLEKKKETMIYRDFDDNGYTPSGGEAQRLALARAVYRDSKILILDEPTASLDPNIEYELNKKIRGKLHGKKTVINVSHRLHSVRYSNKIFVFHGGRLIESGTHEELFASPTMYRQMFSRQAGDYMDLTGMGIIDEEE